METRDEPASPDAERAAELEYRAFADAQLARQAVDRAWVEALGLGGKIDAALSLGSSVASIDCRTTLCKVTTFHRDMDAYRAFQATAFAFGGSQHIWDGPARLMIEEPAVQGAPVRVTMYLGREALPSLPRPSDTASE